MNIHIVKGADPRFVEILRLTDDDVRLVSDQTDGRYPRSWRLDVLGDGRSDAQWCPAIGPVGWRAEYPDATLVRRTEGGPSTREPFGYAVGIQAHGRNIDYGGDVGVVDAVLVTSFTPHVGQTDDGYTEHHHWAVKDGRAIGLVRYEEIRHGNVARSFTFNRYAPARSVPLSSLIVHPIPDPPFTPPKPPTPLMPTLIPRDQFADAFRQVNDFYSAADGLKRPGGMVIDVDGVPTADVQALIQWGYDLAAGMPVPLVLSRIRQSDEWKTKHPETAPTDPTEPTPDPGPSQVLPVVVDGRILRSSDGAALDYREASFFMVLARWLGQNGGSPAQMVEAFKAWRRKGINTLRGFVSIGHPNFWQSRGWLLTPRTPGIYKALHDCTVAAAAEGIRMRWTLLADTGDVFRDGADVRAHVVACMDALRGLPVIIEICNEPTMNGYGSGWAQEMADLGRSLDESAVIALGPEHGATGHLATADIPPADVVFFHAERVLNEGGWAWVRRLGEYGVVKDGRRPVISGEPVNAGDEGAPGDYLRDPAIWFAYGAISRLVVSHGYAPTFHYHDGLFAEMPNEATDRCLQAFIAGCDAVPLDVRSWAWTNGHHAEAPWRGYDQTDPPSDNRPSRIYGRRSGGTYWGVSLREPKGWSWSDLRYPVERVACAEGERFDCSVWRGRLA